MLHKKDGPKPGKHCAHCGEPLILTTMSLPVDDRNPEIVPVIDRDLGWQGEKLTFLGNFQISRVKEASLQRSMIVSYVKQLFRRSDFPQEIFIALADSTVSSVGDIIWANMDCEHPHDFIPMPCIDQLVLNLPSKTQFLKAMGVENFNSISPEAEDRFWGQYPFNFADRIEGVKISWH